MWKAPTMASLHIDAPIWLMTQKTSQEYLSRCAAAVLWGWQCAHVLHQAWTFADSDPKLRSGPKNCVLRCVFCVCKDTNLRKLSNLSPPQGYVDSRKSRLFNLMIFQYVSLFSQQTLWSWRLQCWITRVNTYLIDIQNLSGFKRQTTNNFFRRLFGSWWFVIIYLTTAQRWMVQQVQHMSLRGPFVHYWYACRVAPYLQLMVSNVFQYRPFVSMSRHEMIIPRLTSSPHRCTLFRKGQPIGSRHIFQGCSNPW